MAKYARSAPTIQAEREASDDPFAMATLVSARLAQANRPPGGHTTVVPRPPTRALPALVEPLSERELEIVRLIADGMTNQQIADRLHLVVGTVKVHNHHIFGKLGVSNRVQASARVRELNLLHS
ncbi:MAG: response regulator transcription factor [Anaerolineales bacterium]|nr:response regulator transcription factor [Anaerolineales bacterium]